MSGNILRKDRCVPSVAGHIRQERSEKGLPNSFESENIQSKIYHLLNARKQHYKNTGQGLSCHATIKMLPGLKHAESTKWLREADAQVLQQKAKDLDQAYEKLKAEHDLSQEELDRRFALTFA